MSYYQVKNLEQYFKHYNKSIREPRKFWGKIASENFKKSVGLPAKADSPFQRRILFTEAGE